MEKKVSIILPSLNVVNYIQECIESVINQTLIDIEIICVDAGSTDGTREILQKYADSDSRISILDSRIKSYGYQLNLGMDYAKGKYIGIVETDDFIVPNMYEILYEYAEKNAVDYVKANYYSFFTLKNGERIFSEELLFDENTKYNSVVKPQNVYGLFECDNSVWKGIYRKDFIKKNNIQFQETPGAAFQDLGFMLQVLFYAEQAIYINKALYCYCRDREEASSNTKNVLKYSYQEFSWLLEKNNLKGNFNEKYDNGFYRRMSYSFVGEYIKVSRMYNYLKCEELNIYYNWFKEKIGKAISQNIITREDFNEEIWFLLDLLLDSQEDFIAYLNKIDTNLEDKKNKLLTKIKNKSIVIFGCGKYGRDLYLLLDKEQYTVMAICDNDKKKWGTKFGEHLIQEPKVCIDKYQDACFVIANKKYSEVIKKQLINLGVNSIVIYEK